MSGTEIGSGSVPVKMLTALETKFCPVFIAVTVVVTPVAALFVE